MCGIAGVCNIKDGIKKFNNLDTMLNVIHHRGPNDTGVFKNEMLHFGMKRLSIIDLKNGNQPFHSDDGKYTIIYNGEIYNYIELKKQLESLGYKFNSDSDTEVVLKMFEVYGTDSFNKFNGMFALAIWNHDEKKLLLARDRYGKKPLHYLLQGNNLYFGSEIKSIICNDEVLREVDFKSLDLLLTYNYIPYPYTMFKNIFKVSPGSYLIYDSNGLVEEKYYNFVEVVNQKIRESYSENDFPSIIEELDELIDDAVRIRLRSDVPIGAFLSGGVDSSTIVKYMSNHIKPKTFSIGFSDERFSELKYSQYVAELLETDHYFKIVESNSIKDLPQVIWHTDQPHGDISFLPYGTVSQLASEHIKVVLTGDGADEIYGGYDKYQTLLENKEDWDKVYFERNSVFLDDLKQQLYTDALKEKTKDLDSFKEFKKRLDSINGDEIQKVLYTEVDMLLEGNNLEKPDRMTMAHSIEARSPFMDYRIIEQSFKIPSSIKFHESRQKFVLKTLLENYLPYDFVNRKKAMFTVPIGEWFKDELKDFIYEILLDKKTIDREIFCPDFVKKMLDLHVSGLKNYTRQIRLLLVIELWFRIFIDNNFIYPPKIEELI